MKPRSKAPADSSPALQGVTQPMPSTGAAPQEERYLISVAVGRAQDSVRSLNLGPQKVVVGSGADCALVLRDRTVSRRHLELWATAEGVQVRDLGSTNGTTYLGQRIERALVRPGTRLHVGQCELDIVALSPGPSAELPKLDGYGGLIGSSLPMRRLYAMLRTLEATEVPVLLEGETGTGKDVVARALHEKSARKGQPLVVVDCTSLTAELVESQLFGHRKGAFTGASSAHAGVFEEAAGGTVFLDELSELPLALQPKLLRVLETGRVQPVGGASPVRVDFRLISASQRPLADEVAKGRFRQDLFHRVAVVRVALPPLRDRREDIPQLADSLAQELSAGKVRALPASVHEFLLRNQWPGNVRELRNAVQRILALGASLPSASGTSKRKLAPVSVQYREARDKVVADFERAFLGVLLEQHQGNLSAVARSAGIDRKQLRELLKRHGLY